MKKFLLILAPLLLFVNIEQSACNSENKAAIEERLKIITLWSVSGVTLFISIVSGVTGSVIDMMVDLM